MPEPDGIWQFHTGDSDCLCKACNQRREAACKLEEDVLEITGKEIANKVADYINGCRTSKYFIDGMNNQHRTLQQSFTRLCVDWIEHLASLNGKGGDFYDLRNQASVKFAKRLTETVTWQDGKYLPHI